MLQRLSHTQLKKKAGLSSVKETSLPRHAYLKMVARNRFVIGQTVHFKLHNFVDVTKIDEERSRTFPIECGREVVRSG